MTDQPDPHVISTLQMEYNAIRQEIRDLVNSMDTNLNLGISMATGAIALAALFKEMRMLYILPSLFFSAACIHITKTAATNVRGAYCQIIEARLKSFLGSDTVLLDWEGGKLFRHIAGPAGIVQIGFYILFSVIASAFIAVASLAYRWQIWTAYVHVVELVAISCYAVLAIRWNTAFRRKDILRLYSINVAEERIITSPAQRQ